MKRLFLAAIFALIAVTQAWATSPTVVNTNTSVGAASTTQTVSLPASIVAGRLLFIALGCDNNITTDSSATGWTQVRRKAETTASLNTIHGLYKWAAGDEGASVAVTIGATEPCGHAAYQISGAINPATQAPEASAGVKSSDVGAPEYNPDTVTPTGGSKDYLFIAVCSSDGTTTATAAPTDYINLLTIASGGDNANDAAVMMATKAATASSEDPGAFTGNRADEWACFTVAVHPALARRASQPIIFQ